MDLSARLEAVEAENDMLRARIADLEVALGARFAPPVEWRLTPAEVRVLGVLLARELATKPAIMAALYHDTSRDAADPKIADVFICKIRKKVGPFGLAIETVWGQGWAVSRRQRDAVLAGTVRFEGMPA